MMKYSERRARERALATAAKPSVMEAAGAAMGDFRREIAFSISLLDSLERQYANGSVSPQQDGQVIAWAAAATPTFRRLAIEFAAVNASLARVMAPPAIR